MSVILLPSVVFHPQMPPAGIRLLASIEAVSRAGDLMITSASDGTHSGPTDPHKLGEAFDVRCHDLPNLEAKLARVQGILFACREDDADRIETCPPNGFNTRWFYGFVEDVGTPNEHVHLQRRKGLIYAV